MCKNFQQILENYVGVIENYLNNSCVVYPDEPQQLLFEAMRYSLLAGGKRLRPVLVMDFCKMCGGDFDSAVPFAAAVEMIHTYSLIHDDLPCMDNDDLRRGLPTNHKVFGEAMAVLAGDGLLTSAFAQLVSAKLPAERVIEAVRILSQCSGELGMVGGQVLDIQSENRTCTTEEVINIQSRKTGALIRAACTLGVAAASGSESQMAAAGAFADNLGLAFQIRDDILDVIGDAAELGKATGVDTEKNTFVRLFGVEACEKKVEYHTNLAIDALSEFENPEFMRELANSLTGRKK